VHLTRKGMCQWLDRAQRGRNETMVRGFVTSERATGTAANACLPSEPVLLHPIRLERTTIGSVQEYLWSVLRNRKRFGCFWVRAKSCKGRRVFAEMLFQSLDSVLIVRMI
jgi:hypothetical protein